MRITRRVLINTIAFLVLGMGLVLLLAVQVLPTVFGSTYSMYGIFSAAGGVATNQEVTYRGVQIGRVGKMSLTPDAVKIELVIESGFRIPKEGTRAQVLFKSAVGEQFVDLLPEREDGPVFRQGDVIPINMTSIPIQTEDLLRELDAVLRSIDTKALGTLIHELGTGLTGHGKDLSDAVKALDVFTRIGAQRSREITGIIGNAADVQESFNPTSEDFVRAVSALRTVLETLAARRADLERTLSQTKGLNGEIIALLESKRQQINTILADLGNTVRVTHARLGDVDQLLTYLGPFLNDAAKAFDTPYYVFNLVTNDENPECRYDPSGRPARPVTDDSPKAPTVGFKCPADSAATTSGAIRPLSAPLQVQLDRISWVYLFTLGL
jgi:phospholipid/cholesterol/gamma-HCH transport system substrate-binding protein